MFKLRSILMLIALGAMFAMTSCKKDEEPLKGSLAVAISGLPAGALANVVITGNGFTQTLTTSDTIIDLTVGDYTVTIEDVSTNDGLYAAENGARTKTVKVEGDKMASTTATYAFKSYGSLAVAITGLPAGASAKVTVTGANFTQSLTASDTITLIPQGTYTVKVEEVTTSAGPYTAETGKNEQTVTIVTDQTTAATVTYVFKGYEFGITGEWISQGDSVCTLLSFYFAVDSIYAKFNADQTYLVESFDTAGVKTTYSGTYTQTKSGTGNIFNINITQSTPSVAASEGILEVYEGAPNTMKYEIVQTAPTAAGVPPTATGGFGSTNAGALGTWNVQKYRRVK